MLFAIFILIKGMEFDTKCLTQQEPPGGAGVVTIITRWCYGVAQKCLYF